MVKSILESLVRGVAWTMVIVAAWALARGYAMLTGSHLIDVEWWMAAESALAIACFLVALFLTFGLLLEVSPSEMSKKEKLAYVAGMFAVLVSIPLNMLRAYSEIFYTVRFLPIDLVIIAMVGSMIYEASKHWFHNWVLNRADQIRSDLPGKNNPA